MDYTAFISELTLEEKASLLSGADFWKSRSVARLNIPAISFADGPSGIRRQAEDADHLGLNPGLPATCFPASSTLANSWDDGLVERVGQAIGEEAVALEADVVLGPGLNIKRNPLCGRNFEYYSEDPLLAGKLAASCVRGIQSSGAAACPKHFAANSQELRRMSVDSIVDHRALREIYLTGFEIAVLEGKPLAIMSAYNKINGVYANENEFLLKRVLRDEWGHDGIVVTDWGGSNSHVDGVIAGSNMEMPSAGFNSPRELVEAVRSGQLDEAHIDDRVTEYLSVVSRISTVGDRPAIDFSSHHKLAREAAADSIVLLKNDDNILPLRAGTKTAIIGSFARVPRYQGAGSSQVNSVQIDSTLELIDGYDLQMIGFAEGFNRRGLRDDEAASAAVKLAAEADIVLLYLGLDELAESEGVDREHMRLRDNQIGLLEAVSRVNPRVVVVLSCGAPIEMPWLSNCQALVHGYLGGQAGAGAMLDVLTGRVCPSGKLAESYPISYQDVPSADLFPASGYTAEYRESIYVGYRYYDSADKQVLFPFGFGLSYTKFVYSDIRADEAQVSFTLTNTGSVAGAEIAQIYIAKPDSSVFRPAKELKSYIKASLEPGESRRLSVRFDQFAFRFFEYRDGCFRVEEGRYTILIGASSRDIRLIQDIEVAGELVEEDASRQRLPSYYSADVRHVLREEFSRLYGQTLPVSEWDRTQPLGYNDTVAQLFYARSRLARLVLKIIIKLKKRADDKGEPDLNMLFIINIPFRGIAKMLGGVFDPPMVEALLRIVNGHCFRGLGALIAATVKKIRNNRRFAGKIRTTRRAL
ncbi:MAG: glycoside hydrolase family 3 C-terminal domain-containing protein [Eubacteriales bacterium]|nr:glycoside hydrolase family 3 C-terminal domain-containing protein [Eubacteriales bacterium]MDD3504059.1 glycoside hydrolase family 3 C-terminal domain-containing protein [Eubacteriales bacterium]